MNVEKISRGATNSTDKQQQQQQQDERATSNNYSGAVIATEAVQINLDRSGLNRSMTEAQEPNIPDVRVVDPKSASLKTIDLGDASNGRSAGINNIVSTPIGNIRQGFANGDTIVTLLPVNTRWPWITPAKFRPELVPEELMAQGLTVSLFLKREFPVISKLCFLTNVLFDFFCCSSL